MADCKIVRLVRETIVSTTTSIGKKGRENIETTRTLESVDEFLLKAQNSINHWLAMGYSLKSSNYHVPITPNKFAVSIPAVHNPEEMEFVFVLTKE